MQGKRIHSLPGQKRRGQEDAENAPRTESAEDREKNREKQKQEARVFYASRFGINTVAYRNNCIQIEIFYLIYFTVRSSCCNFCNN